MAAGRSYGPVPARAAWRRSASGLVAEECTKMASLLLMWKLKDRADDVEEGR
jgi:hypothetical protein